MKKNTIFILILVSIISLLFNTNVKADYEGDEYIDFGEIKRLPVVNLDKVPYGQKAINKLDRGVINAATFWLEVPAEVAKVSNEQDPLMGVSVGVVHGLVASVFRAGSAVFDTVTFFAPPYDKPVVKPEYALNRADREIKELFW
jgi:putative exosortase-associated protein (TIGR04073 family)